MFLNFIDSKLDPVMLDADLFDLVKTCLTSVLALPADGAKKGLVVAVRGLSVCTVYN